MNNDYPKRPSIYVELERNFRLFNQKAAEFKASYEKELVKLDNIRSILNHHG